MPQAPPNVEQLVRSAIQQAPRFPVSYQSIDDFFKAVSSTSGGAVNLFTLRRETMKRIQAITKRSLICYVAKTHHVPPGAPSAIDDGDLVGMSDLVGNADGEALDVFITSNRGSPETTERLVHALRERFSGIRFIVAGNAFSAATLGNDTLPDR